METSITSRLLSFPNVIVTSHQAFLTEEALEAISIQHLKMPKAILKACNQAEFSIATKIGEKTEEKKDTLKIKCPSV